MSEPPEAADAIEQIAPGVWHWSIHNSNIGGNLSASHALADEHGCVWIDPVRVNDLGELPRPDAIVLTSRGHQRAAWRYRREFGVPVYGPRGGEGYDEAPDTLYEEGDPLPQGLTGIPTPGFGDAKFALHRAAHGDTPSLMIVGDLVMRRDDGSLTTIPPQFQSDPEAARGSLERVAGEPFDLLLIGHAPPVTTDPHSRLQSLLANG
jgi:metallo-beta-lactamase superfamily protein